MTHSSGCGPAEGLDQSGFRVGDLVRLSLTPQLGGCFDCLVHACSTPGESARFHASHRGTGNSALETDISIRGEFPAFAFNGESNRFQLQYGINAEYIMIFKKIDVVQYKTILFHCPACG